MTPRHQFYVSKSIEAPAPAPDSQHPIDCPPEPRPTPPQGAANLEARLSRRLCPRASPSPPRQSVAPGRGCPAGPSGPIPPGGVRPRAPPRRTRALGPHSRVRPPLRTQAQIAPAPAAGRIGTGAVLRPAPPEALGLAPSGVLGGWRNRVTAPSGVRGGCGMCVWEGAEGWVPPSRPT